MREEFHGNGIAWGEPDVQRQLLYGWNALNVNIWLPSLRELVGMTGNPADWSGCYISVMQELNTSTNAYVDAQGGDQFAYFKQYNQTGGGQVIITMLNNHESWTRSTVYASQQQAWRITNAQQFDWTTVTASLAV